jgi:hypothetical protein
MNSAFLHLILLFCSRRWSATTWASSQSRTSLCLTVALALARPSRLGLCLLSKLFEREKLLLPPPPAALSYRRTLKTQDRTGWFQPGLVSCDGPLAGFGSQFALGRKCRAGLFAARAGRMPGLYSAGLAESRIAASNQTRALTRENRASGRAVAFGAWVEFAAQSEQPACQGKLGLWASAWIDAT